MCLGVPGQVISIERDEALNLATGRVSFGGIVKRVNLSYTPEADVGDYVVVHVGFSISVIDEKEAKRVFSYLRELGELEEVKSTAEGGAV